MAQRARLGLGSATAQRDGFQWDRSDRQVPPCVYLHSMFKKTKRENLQELWANLSHARITPVLTLDTYFSAVFTERRRTPFSFSCSWRFHSAAPRPLNVRKLSRIQG